MKPLLAVAFVLALPTLARASDDEADAQAALALARARQQAPAPPQAPAVRPPPYDLSLGDFMQQFPKDAIVVGFKCDVPSVYYPFIRLDSAEGEGWIGPAVIVGIPVQGGRQWYKFDCHVQGDVLTRFIQQQMNPPQAQQPVAYYQPLPMYGPMMGGGAFCVGGS